MTIIKSYSFRNGYTAVELLVTMVITVVLSVTIGLFVTKLLTIQEQDREEAYFRERLADVCGAIADYLSVATSFSTFARYDSETRLTNQVMKVSYRQEAGGVSFETGVVSHVANVYSSLNTTNKTIDINIDWVELNGGTQRISRVANGNAVLLPLSGDIVSCRLSPLDVRTVGSDGALANLQLAARYKIRNRRFSSDDEPVLIKTAAVERIVRLWNRQ